MAPRAQIPPPLNIPDSNSTVVVHVINSTARIQGIPSNFFFEPEIKGFDTLDPTAFSFLIEHPASSRKLLWDLGVRKDWHDLAPGIAKAIKDRGWKVTVEKGVAEILEEGGVKLEDINSIIWSHSHFDHTGDPSTFPSSTELVVGPGSKENVMPRFPVKEDSTIRESDYKGREVREIEFDNAGLHLGHFRAMDYFGDGSFYLLDSPGHAIGHMCGLCRTTTAPSTFIFLGGDCAHHVGEWRPTAYLPLPDEITPSPLPAIRSSACPGALLAPIHRFHHKNATSPDCDADAMTHPFFTVRDEASYNGAEARESVEHMCEFDAHDNIFTMIAHDNTMLDAIDFFPKASANDWKQKGWREKVMWQFLRDFHEAVAEHVDNEARR